MMMMMMKQAAIPVIAPAVILAPIAAVIHHQVVVDLSHAVAEVLVHPRVAVPAVPDQVHHVATIAPLLRNLLLSKVPTMILNLES